MANACGRALRRLTNASATSITKGDEIAATRTGRLAATHRAQHLPPYRIEEPPEQSARRT